MSAYCTPDVSPSYHSGWMFRLRDTGVGWVALDVVVIFKGRVKRVCGCQCSQWWCWMVFWNVFFSTIWITNLFPNKTAFIAWQTSVASCHPRLDYWRNEETIWKQELRCHSTIWSLHLTDWQKDLLQRFTLHLNKCDCQKSSYQSCNYLWSLNNVSYHDT